jgi:hypothetical protein
VGVLGFDLRDPACMLAAKVDMCGVAVQFPVKPSRIAGGLVVTFWKPEFSRLPSAMRNSWSVRYITNAVFVILLIPYLRYNVTFVSNTLS